MNKAHLELLEQHYIDACNDYLRAFCQKYNLVYDKDAWVGNDVGTVACIGDYFVEMEDIRFMLVNGISWEDFLANMDYNLLAIELGVNTINLRSWCMGCPRLSKEQLQSLISMHKEIDELCKEYKEKY